LWPSVSPQGNAQEGDGSLLALPSVYSPGGSQRIRIQWAPATRSVGTNFLRGGVGETRGGFESPFGTMPESEGPPERSGGTFQFNSQQRRDEPHGLQTPRKQPSFSG
jgi:hypothetical protein